MLDRAEAVGYHCPVLSEAPYSIWPYTMAIVGILPEHAYGPDYGELRRIGALHTKAVGPRGAAGDL